jgi:hypothetical protein
VARGLGGFRADCARSSSGDDRNANGASSKALRRSAKTSAASVGIIRRIFMATVGSLE